MRRILHVDMDAFYASVEQRDDPSLRGRPVAVGGRSGRGVVCAASYEARRFGVRSAMPMSRALSLCPGLVVVPPDFSRYSEASHAVFGLFREVTPLVEPLSLDEAFLDVTENAWNEPLGVNVARRLKERIRETTGLTASAGVAPNKLIAKIASGFRKPDGLTVVPPARADAFLRDLPVDTIPGVGPVTARRLKDIGVERVADLRTTDPAALVVAVGGWAEGLVRLAHGEDESPVVPDRPRKSVGSETTFPADLRDEARVREAVRALADELGPWLVEHETVARTVTLKVRYGDFDTITRSDTRRPWARDAVDVRARALSLLARTEAGRRPVRLLGVSLHGLEPAGEGARERQLVLFPEPATA